MNDHRVCQKCLVSGRVQGVFFRASTAAQARQLNLDGYAVNLDDGRVEVLVAGARENVRRLVAWLAEGPPAAAVSGVECTEAESPDWQGFRTG